MDEIAIRTAEMQASATVAAGADDAPRAWQMIENGRYQPRRIKGSCLGRELG